jgi:polyferredoxin
MSGLESVQEYQRESDVAEVRSNSEGKCEGLGRRGANVSGNDRSGSDIIIQNVRGKIVKKIPQHLRRTRIRFGTETNWLRRFLRRLKDDSQFLRSGYQFAFALLCVWIGIEFYLFMRWGQSNGAEQFVSRPPGVEGFLPISSLISLKYWVETGIVNDVHPSGLSILLAIVALGFLLKKAFCSWLCPIGTVSESLWRLGEKLFKRNLRISKWLDVPLRSLKYALLFFFVYAIWHMDIPSMKAFIDSPYNKVADIKMYLFFAEITSFSLSIIVVLAALSIVVKNFWCRYLCPYGALLGIISLVSPFKITRIQKTCIDCELCTKACPANIKVHSATRVWSDECMNCMECVEVCPVKNTLNVRLSASAPPVPGWAFGTLVAGIFMAITGLALLTGLWQNNISNEEYLERFQRLDSPVYQHFR